jgi:hypothetical protein
MKEEMDMTLKEKLDGRREEFKKTAPPDDQEIMHRSTEDLRKSGIIDRALNVGDRGPGFELKNAEGVLVRSYSLLSAGPLVLAFYRGKW